ncbi:hypothetical protein MAPG_10290 [Magnaporthiopsis poae ATCC 64411]|uniref:Uncharacterized protein n=1 Tax=Magnaporthiopsis poae (strain ATCC 64411 / 73-15) TaxID=644358 RepID=A0A0C4EC76_MAGP6|nr:hypothetical protein MAPG_10290 [Magnaporthiopsis poae ATCC 64411]
MTITAPGCACPPSGQGSLSRDGLHNRLPLLAACLLITSRPIHGQARPWNDIHSPEWTPDSGSVGKHQDGSRHGLALPNLGERPLAALQHRRRLWRRFCCCCFCWGDGTGTGNGTPLWARRLWAWIVFNRCLVYGIVAAVLCTIIFGVIFGAVLPRLSSQPSSPRQVTLFSFVGLLVATSLARLVVPPPSIPASHDVPSQCSSSECSSTPLSSPTASTTSSASSTSSTSTSSRPAPTNLPPECNTNNYIAAASFLAVHGDPNYLFSFSASRNPDECCTFCYRRVDTGCHGWRFTPGSATLCTYIHSYNGTGPKDKTCPHGADVPVDIAADDSSDGPNKQNVAGIGPCGSLG